MNHFFDLLSASTLCTITTTRSKLEVSDQSGPYRFYARDPDGYIVEIHTWEGVAAD